jgi:DNA polymerase
MTVTTSWAKNLSIDIETYSSIDLNNCGVYKYVEANDFEVLLFGYSVDGGVTRVVDLASGETIPSEIIALLKDECVTNWAFNASFERICLSKFLGLPPGE